MAAPHTEFALGRVLPGSRYRIQQEIGQGGMGTVFEVEHVELGKRFVLKAVLQHRASGSDLVRRLREEWRALGRLEHPNIVSVTDAGTTDGGVAYYVMERLIGEDLATRLRRERRLPVRDAVRIGGEVLDALDAAHRIGVVHRDVKPSNVYLTRQGTTKLLDFGIAKLLDSDIGLTRQGAAVGTPRYMSPEQVCGEAVDSRSDLYAVGLLLFEMLAGQSPFEGCNDQEVFDAHLNRAPRSVAEFVPEVPEELAHLVSRLLAKEPARRPSSAGSAAALLRAMRTTFGSVPPERPGQRSRERFSRETIDAVRALLARSETTGADPDAPTVPSAGPPGTLPEIDTRTEVLTASSDEVDTRTNAQQAHRTPEPVSAAPAVFPPRPAPVSTGWWGPSRMLVAGLLGGSIAVGVVVLLLTSAHPDGANSAEDAPPSNPIGSSRAATAASGPAVVESPRPEAAPSSAQPDRPTPSGASAPVRRPAPKPSPPVRTPPPPTKSPPARQASPGPVPGVEPVASTPRRRLPTSGL